MPWSDLPTVIKKMFNYFGPEQHEKRVTRKFIGRWDIIRKSIQVAKEHEDDLEKMDKLRKELK